MRILFIFTLVVALLTGCKTLGDNPQPNALEGEWQLELETLAIGEQEYTTFDGKNRKMIKIFTDSHFAFSSIGTNRPRFNSYQLTADQKVVAFDNYGGSLGRYTYENDTLIEHIEYSSFPNYEGVSIPFKITIIDNTMIQEGLYPLIELGLGDQDGYLRSTFKRIE
ncbi:lipocalin-like domain-containing protein [Pseudoalteromonas neustonica]|uniref:Uncharacterized protein n=2 Tax=Pseudoalteromonas TaxID=53246 RepID=A0A0N1ELT0_9GAMM|nr:MULTISPECIES: lipocalin-like domain-containing protein [Pseudoalteromonas]KPH64646.1 hypothetical protein ADS77_05065 [Pseudoalteromonas porphyrae]NMR26894.1 hypothetical protein [Pseudoalteromonas sp. NEC-BIFX-2020_015]